MTDTGNGPASTAESSQPAEVTWKEPEVGEVYGSYRIIERIGGGGMALIYRVEHTRIGRQAAMKVLRPALAARGDEVERFFVEARAVNEVAHPNIVDIADFVEDDTVNPPLVYMVMELLEGEDLDTRIKRDGALGAEVTIRLGVQIVDALSAVHRAKILHRDLKPSNIYLQDQGLARGPTVKLLDFGLVKAFGPREQRALTETEVLIGTPEYMSPEHILGKSLDQRADIYCLGLVLYEMLTGTRPFEGEKGEILVAQAREPPPSMVDKSCEPIPQDLVDLVMRCLQKDPGDRFQTMDEVHQALYDADVAKLSPPRKAAFFGSDGAPIFLRQKGRWIGLAGLLSVVIGVGGYLFFAGTGDRVVNQPAKGANASPALINISALPSRADASRVSAKEADASAPAPAALKKPAPEPPASAWSKERRRVQRRKHQRRIKPKERAHRESKRKKAQQTKVGTGTVDPFAR